MTEAGRQPTDAAVRKVLEAERGARARIDAAEKKATATLETARADARRIEADAVAAARKFQATCADKAEDGVARLRAAAEQRLAQLESESILPREPLNNPARSAFQSGKPQIVRGEPSDSSRSYGRGSQRARCGFSGETLTGRASHRTNL